MWIRDSFPLQCIHLGARGRFSALGYDDVKIRDKKPKTIRYAAEEILHHVRADRPLVSPTNMLKKNKIVPNINILGL